MAVEAVAGGELGRIGERDLRRASLVPHEQPQRQVEPDAWVGLHEAGSDCGVAEDEQDLVGELETGLAGSGGVVDGSEERDAAGA